jgi:protein-S-isoprenylcysteine O-methyltransferase Ste14
MSDQGSTMVEGGFLQRGGGWVVLQNLLCIGVLVAAPVPSGRWMNASPVPAILGGFLVLAGAWFGIGGVRALGLNRTPYPQPLLKSQLVTRGVYQWLRHPLYASLIYLGVGWALLWASWAGLIGAGVRQSCSSRNLFVRNAGCGSVTRITEATNSA